MLEPTRPIMSLGSCRRCWQLAGVVAGGGVLTLLLAYSMPPVARSPIPVSTPKTSSQPRLQRLLTRNLYKPNPWRTHPKLCPDQGAQVRLLILLSSTPARTARRMAVRLTWGHYTGWRDITVAFVLGAPTTDAELRAIAAEDALYGDVIVSNTVHDDGHTTPRTISMLEWMSRHCPQARHLLKAEDDVFLNVPWLLSFTSGKDVEKASRTIWESVMRKALPSHNLQSKYYVSMVEFPWKGPYPDFTTGLAYLMSNDCVRPLLEAATMPRRRYLRLEDVFITGVLATELGIQRVHTPAFYNQRRLAPHLCDIQSAAAVHTFRYYDQFYFYRMLSDPRYTQNSTDKATLQPAAIHGNSSK